MLLRRAQVHGLAELNTVAEGSPRPAQPPWWGPSLPFAFHSTFHTWRGRWPRFT